MHVERAVLCLFEMNFDTMVHPMLSQSLLAADAHHLSANQNQEQEQGLHRQHDTTRCDAAYHHPHASRHIQVNMLVCVRIAVYG